MMMDEKGQGNSFGKVLVLGSDDRSLLAVIRSLGRKRLSVHLGWVPPDSLARYSKYVKMVHNVPPYSPSDETWKKTLLSILNREKFDLVIPCSDPTLIPLQMHRSIFAEFGSILLLNNEAFEVAFDKWKTNQLARSLYIPVPRERMVSKIVETTDILSEFKFPVVLKPRRSFNLNNLRKKNKVRKVHNPEDLKRFIKVLIPQGEILIQENFEGVGMGVELLVDHGKILYAFQHLRIHEPLSGGGSSYRKSVEVDSELLEASTKLIEAMRYTGIVMVEFKFNPKTGDWVLMEINGRFWGSLPLAVAAGADFPYYLYQFWVEGKRDFPSYYKRGLFCRNLTRDLEWTVQVLRDNRLGRFKFAPIWQIIKDLLNIFTFRERNDTFVMDDIQPGLMETVHLAGNLLKRTSKKIKLWVLRKPGFRNRNVKKARSALKKANTVLFLCKGNICRSPFAQYYAQTVFPKSKMVMSSGFYPEEGRLCTGEAVQAAKDFGIDLTSHCSSVVTEEIIRQADIILTFDEENRESLNESYPWAGGKVYPIVYLDTNGPLMINDPFGEDVEVYRKVYRNLEQLIKSAGEI